MKKIRTFLWAMVLSLSFLALVLCSPTSAEAAGSQPAALDNLSVGLRSTSGLVSVSSGYMRVYYDGAKICVEYLDSSFSVTSRKSIAMELDIWGGFYAGSDAYYLVEGKNNTAESDSAEVIRVIKYSTSWNKLGTAKITGNPDLFGGQVRYPFDYGCVEMTEWNGTLYVVTGHEGYVDPAYNQGHQGFLMIAVNESDMTGKIVKSDLWHSFAQYIETDGSNLYVLEQSEGSRCTTLSKIQPDTLSTTSISVLDYGGSRTSAWAISCYASVDDLALSTDHVLCLGTSIDQSQYDAVTSSTAHNLYLTVTPKSNFSQDATTVKWITSYSGGGKSFLGTNITKINNNRFLITWEETDTEGSADVSDTLSGHTLHYVFVDGSGNKISSEFTASASISDCHPIVKGSSAVFYASSSNMVDFYAIRTDSGKMTRTGFRTAGENVSWKIQNGTLTFSGSGAISVDTGTHYRYPLSSCSSWYVYSNSDNAWSPVRDSVKKMVIGDGITEIPDGAFQYFSNMTEVTVGTGVTKIGEKAFAYCSSLRKITIPDNVKTIGDDILWTGYYWTSNNGHVVQAAIYCYTGSAALKYAKDNGISYQILTAASGEAVTVGKYRYKVTSADTTGKGKVRLTKVVTKSAKVTIPATVTIYGISYKVTSVGKSAFKGNTKMTSLRVGKNVTSIGASAFENCTKLKTVTGCAAVKTVGNRAFYGDKVLTSVAGMTKLTVINSKAFYNCKKLARIGSKKSTVTLAKIQTIGTYAFRNCTSLKKVNLTSTALTSIGGSAFRGCTSMTSFVSKSTKLKRIGTNAFYGDKKLASVTLKTTKLTTSRVKANAFKGIKSTCTFRVPEKKVSDYKKIFKAKGSGSKIKVKKA